MSPSPYPTIHSKETGNYFFTTKSGYLYTVYFDTKSAIFPNERLDAYAVYIGFYCAPEIEKFEGEYDPQIGATIMWLIANFFRNNKYAILTYVCSSKNHYARHRFITFNKWYNESGLSERLDLKKKIIGKTYCGALISKKNPLMASLDIALVDFNPDKPQSGWYEVHEEEEDYDLDSDI